MHPTLSPYIILAVLAVYFLVLVGVSRLTSRKSSNSTFFLADRKAPWYLVAFGMIGASISGVTFISIPGKVGAGGLNMAFSYMQMVMGYFLGYLVIAGVLMPIYYRMNLISIYTYLEERLGHFSYKTGAAFFLLSRTIGSAFRMYLVATVLQTFVLEPLGVPFPITAMIVVFLIWIYTYKGGANTVLWTDTLQTVFLLSAVWLTISAIGTALEKNIPQLATMVWNSEYSQMFFFKGGWSDPNNFFKQFVSGALITIVMTGLDQDLMQKNLTCRNLSDARKNMLSFSVVLIFVNLSFLFLGALLYLYAANLGIPIPVKSDMLYPTIAFQYLSPVSSIIFILGLVAAAYASADSALTSLTTSFCIDFLNFQKQLPQPSYYEEDVTAQQLVVEDAQKKVRFKVHIGASVVLLLVIILFNIINKEAVINGLFEAASYTYGPLLGLFSFGLITKWQVKDRFVPWVCVASPVISYLINFYSSSLLDGFKFGFLILAVNGFLTFIGLVLLRKKDTSVAI